MPLLLNYSDFLHIYKMISKWSIHYYTCVDFMTHVSKMEIARKQNHPAHLSGFFYGYVSACMDTLQIYECEREHDCTLNTPGGWLVGWVGALLKLATSLRLI